MTTQTTNESRVLLLDTSYLVAVFNQRDVHHSTALAHWKKAADVGDTTLLLLDWVWLEFTNILMRRVNIQASIQFADALRRTTSLRWLKGDTFMTEAWPLYASQKPDTDKPLSFVDATLAIIARKTPTTPLATFDQGFRQIADIQIEP